MFIPTAAPERADIPAVPDIAALVKDYRGSDKVAAGETFEATPANIDRRTIVRKLPGGMKLALLPKKTRGATVVAQLTLRWGDEASKSGRSAACGLASAMLMRGTAKHTREQIRDEFDRLKASVGVGGEGASIETVRENLPAVLRLVAEILREPAFPAAEFEQLKSAALTGIQAQRGEPGSVAGLQIGRHLNPYPPEHWLYTPTLEERIARLDSVGVEDLKRCHADFYGATDGDMAVVGDFDPDEITRLTGELFDDWKSPRAFARIPGRFHDAPAINRNLATPDKANAVFRAGLNLRLRDDNPDHAALTLGNYLLGGSSSSRLTRRVREQEGLSYSVRSWLSAGSVDELGEFGVSAIYAPQNRARIEAAINDVLQQALRDGFSEEELAQAKNGYLESRKLARTQDYSIAGRLATNLYLGRTMAWDADFDARIAALTTAQIQAALRRHLDPQKLSIVKAGDFARVAGGAAVAEK
jgi:zinc protease